MIEPEHPKLSIARQCELVSISRSGFYYRPAGETPLNPESMRLIDAQFLETPWYGSRQMARHLRREGHTVGRKRVRRLDGQDGAGADLPAAAHDGSTSRAPGLPVFAAGFGDRPAQPGLVQRHHLYSHATWLPLPGRDHGLGDPQGAVLAGVQHNGCRVLR